MIRTLAALTATTLMGAGFITLTQSVADADAAPAYSLCEYEDSTHCVWDARHQGNGIGRSALITKEGKVIFIPHRAAHALTH